jgi:hypothetical protein
MKELILKLTKLKALFRKKKKDFWTPVWFAVHKKLEQPQNG